MKKRLLAICLTLCLCIGMLPSAAMAELEQTPMGGDEGESPSDLSEPTPAETVYVSAAGSDESGDGSEGNPICHADNGGERGQGTKRGL